MRRLYSTSVILGLTLALLISAIAVVIWTTGVFIKFNENFSTIERFSVLALPTLSVVLIFLLILLFQDWQAERIATYGMIIVTLGCVGTALVTRQDYVTLLVAWLATLGWLISNIVSIRNTRTTHTFNVIVELRSNQLLQFHRENIFSALGYSTQITRKNVVDLIQERDACKDWKASYPVLQSITFVANLYDNIAYGVRYHELDKKAVQFNIRNLIVYFYEDYYAFIAYYNEKDKRSLEHLIWLAREFGAKMPR